MNYISYDLEWDSNAKKEIIEIGATKIKFIENRPVIFDSFQRFVKPKHPYSHYCEKLTQIPREIIEQAQSFAEVYKEFVDWIGEEEHAFCSWGNGDKNIFSVNCNMNDVKNIIHYNNDIQIQISKTLGGNSDRVGLKRAIEILNIEHEAGEYHRADFDAEGTAKVMIKFINDLDIKSNIKSSSRRKKKRKENINSLMLSDKKQMAAWMENRLPDILEDLPTLVRKEIMKDIEKWEEELKILKKKVEEIFKIFNPETDGEFYDWVKGNYWLHSAILFKMYCEVDINEFSWRRHLYNLTFHRKQENAS